MDKLYRLFHFLRFVLICTTLFYTLLNWILRLGFTLFYFWGPVIISLTLSAGFFFIREALEDRAWAPRGVYKAIPGQFKGPGGYAATSCACATASAIRPRVGQSRKGQKGQGLIEYALILTFIAVVIVTAILWFEKSAILPGLFQSLFNGLGQ